MLLTKQILFPAASVRVSLSLSLCVCVCVCLCVCLFVRSDTEKLLIRNRCNLVGICVVACSTFINSGRATLLNTAHTVGLHCGASLSADCAYNPS